MLSAAYQQAAAAFSAVQQKFPKYRQAAEAIALDLDAFDSCMDDGRNLAIVNANREAARSNRVSGTPTFFLNDETLSGAQPLEVFAQTINSLLAAQ